MKLIRRIVIGFGIATLAVCFGAIILFNWSVTGFKALTVPTGSMRPNINPGSVVLMHRVPVNSLHIGDVITYANPLEKGQTISHRIIKTYLLNGKVPAFITKGDANPTADRPVVGGQVQGKVTAVVPYVGTALLWTHTIVGLIAIIYIPALMVIISEIRRLAEYYRQFMPYKAAVILAREEAWDRAHAARRKVAAIPVISSALLAGSIFLAFPVHALLKSNTVSLGPNILTVAKVTPPNTCAGGNNSNNSNTNVNISGSSSTSNTNTVIINSSTSQTATTGNADVSGNTTGGSATSGNATNCNNTNTTINITNH